MKHKFFRIPVLASETAEAELNQFCDQYRIVNIEKHFVAEGANSYWAFCVTWLAQDSELAKTSPKNKKPRVDYKEVLNEEDFQHFSQLRDLRSMLAEQEGVAVYNIFTNEQLAAMVEKRITSKMALLELEGVGQTRVEKYGDTFLAKLQQCLGHDDASVHPA